MSTSQAHFQVHFKMSTFQECIHMHCMHEACKVHALTGVHSVSSVFTNETLVIKKLQKNLQWLLVIFYIFVGR